MRDQGLDAGLGSGTFDIHAVLSGLLIRLAWGVSPVSSPSSTLLITLVLESYSLMEAHFGHTSQAPNPNPHTLAWHPKRWRAIRFQTGLIDRK